MLHQQTNQGQFPCGNKQALGLHWPHQTYTYDLLCLCVCKTRVTIRWNLLERPQAKHKTLLMLMTPFFPKKVLFYPLGLFLFISTVGLGLASWLSLLGCFRPSKGPQVLWRHHLAPALAPLPRPGKVGLSASFWKPDSHTFYTSKPHGMTSVGWHKWTLTRRIIHPVAFPYGKETAIRGP